MKRFFLLLTMLLFSATTMLFPQRLELKTIGSTTKLPAGLWESADLLIGSNYEIVDVLDNYLVCKRPNNPYQLRTNIFLFAKDLSSVKFLETPEEYAGYSPYYICKVGDCYLIRLIKNSKHCSLALYDKHLNFVKVVPMGEYENYVLVYLGKVGDKHFAKLVYRNKKYAIVTFDEQMNFVKAEKMDRFGWMCSENNYVYLQNISLKAKPKDLHNGELIKMDKDMNIVVRKPITALWNFFQGNRHTPYQMVDTLGHTIFCNYGTYMTVDKETLDQKKLDVRSGASLSICDTIIFEAEKIIRIASDYSKMSVSFCDYEGNGLQTNIFESKRDQTLAFLEYRNNKVYAMLNAKKDISIVAFDIETGTTDTVSTFQMEQNPGYTHSISVGQYVRYDVSADIWKYDDNSYNLVVKTEVQDHYDSYQGYLSYFHIDKDFRPIKMEEETYAERNIGSINRCSYQVLHHSDDYTLMMQFKPDKGEMNCEVQYVIWDKFGNRKIIPTHQKARFSNGGPYSKYSRGFPIYYPAIYQFSPDHYYILTGIADESYILTELKVKP